MRNGAHAGAYFPSEEGHSDRAICFSLNKPCGFSIMGCTRIMGHAS